jgi:hypothetical protein
MKRVRRWLRSAEGREALLFVAQAVFLLQISRLSS